MQEPVTADRIIAELLATGRMSGSPAELLEKSGAKIKELLLVDYVKVSDTYSTRAGITPLEEFAINTGKPYVDNRLSDYSAFQELVRYYNTGFRSCALLPASAGGKNVFVLTLLSRQEDTFGSALIGTSALLSEIIAYQVVAISERDRSLGLARYFDAAFDNGTMQMLVDRSGAIVKANKAAMAALGKTARDVGDRKMGDLLDMGADMLDGLAKGRAIEVKGKRGEGATYRVSGSRVNDKLILISAYDVSESKLTEEEARLLEHSPDDVFMLLDGDTKISWVSGNAMKILKIRKEILTGSKLSDLVKGGSGLAAAIGASPDAYATPLKINSGNDMFTDVKSVFVRNSLGGFSCVLSNNSTEKYVDNVRKALEDLVDYSGDAIISTDQFGYIKSLNKSAEKLFNYRNGELNGNTVTLMYFDQPSQEKLSASIALAKANGSVSNLFVTMRVKGSEDSLPCEQSIRSVTDADNVLVGYMIITKELATKRMNEMLQEEVDELARENERVRGESEMKTKFIYNISHDLKTPLTNIKGYTKLFNEGTFGELTEEQKEYITVISNESDRLMQLIMQILEVAKLESGKIKLDLQQVNLNELAKNPSLSTLALNAQKKGLEFGWSIDYNVPEIQADPNRLIQVFANLIGNALKFTEKGSIRLIITRRKGNVKIEVADTGIGISREDRIKLFKKFYQVQRKGLTMQEGSGTGLGLSIVKEIVNLHGGKIGVVSEAGKGSTFWFTLPISGKKKRKKEEAAKQ
ncbi:Methyl sulfide methyltransferase-associated sensor [uncultured archaeon]|nr:Methyl sulfide methyltransferase-associated sensor [uncultured archaeon]